VYDVESNNLLQSFQAHTSTITRIKQSPFNNTNYVATCSSDFTVKIWNPLNSPWDLLRHFTGHSNTVWSLEFINENMIATGSGDHTIKIWSLSNGLSNMTINVSSIVNALKLLSNGFYLAAGIYDLNINIYNIKDGSLIKILQGHTSRVNDLVLISSNLLASSSSDTTVRIWDLMTYSEKFVLMGHVSSVYGLKLVSSGELASCSVDTTIKVWNTANGAEKTTLTGHKETVFAFDLLNGQTLVSGSWDKTIKVWDWSTGQCLNTIKTDLVIFSLTTIRN
jgi:WD40 repeat protein